MVVKKRVAKKLPAEPVESTPPRETLADILTKGSPLEIRALFCFDYTTETKELIHKKFKLFTKAFFSRYFSNTPAPFHDAMVQNLLASYMGQNFLNLAYRGSAKSTLAKLFLVFVILNDSKHFRKYIKVLSKDGKNPKQIVTDIYNMCVEVRDIYGDVFEKDNKDIKREERMDSFTMRSGVKVTASTVGQTQRGNVQDAYRPDYIVLDDVEDSESVRSQAITESIILTIEEAFNGLAQNGSWTCLGNYISEDGVIQYLREKRNKIEMLTPIATDLVLNKGEFVSCKPTWTVVSEEKVKEIYYDTQDFWGEMMCDPVRSEGKFFDQDRIQYAMQFVKEPYKTENGIKYFLPVEFHHRYGIGADTSEGIGKDSSALTLWDFRTGELTATFHDNKMPPELFAYTLAKVGHEYNDCVIAPEINNLSGGIVITTLKEIYQNIFRHTDARNYSEKLSNRIGWYTTSLTKTQALMDFRKAFNDGIVKIYDKELLQEMQSYSQSDLADTSKITRHFDLLMAAVIGYATQYTDQDKNKAVVVTSSSAFPNISMDNPFGV